MSKATFIYADTLPYNTSHYRVLTPAKYLRLAGHEIVICHVSEVTPEKISEVVLFERELSISKIDVLRSLGVKRLIFTFDDAYRNLPRSTAAWAYWHGVNEAASALREIVDRVDVAVVPSQNLARDYRAQLLPNYLDPELWENLPKPVGDRIVIGWGGSTGHYLTWQNQTFVSALKRICDEFPNVVVKLFGRVADDIAFVHGVRAECEGWTDFEDWPKRVSKFDIGLAPLSGKYDSYRSNLKLLEYGLASVPWVASPDTQEYVKADGGILALSDEKAWVRALRKLVKDPDLRRDMGGRGRAWAEKYLMPQHVSEYEKLLWG